MNKTAPYLAGTCEHQGELGTVDSKSAACLACKGSIQTVSNLCQSTNPQTGFTDEA